MTTQWPDSYADRMERVQSSIIREILKMMAVPGIISFAGGLPAPEFFPKERIAAATQRILMGEQGTAALQYGITEGFIPLRELIVERMSRRGIELAVENVVITSGAQQALDTVGKLLVTPGDRILVENPTYLGAIQAWNLYGADWVTIETDEQGMVPDALEAAIKAGGAKLIYLVPNFQNPTGITLTGERRQQIVELANRYQVPIVEDDAYGDLRYEGEDIDPLLAYDARVTNGLKDGILHDGNVLYMGTFSKSLCPGVRIGWVAGPSSVIRRFVQAKQSADLHTSTFTQMVVHETSRDGWIDEHVQMLRSVYQERRDLMMSLMEEKFPAGTSWTQPEGGLFLWATLPEQINATELLNSAVEQLVAYVPGSPFFPNGGGHNTLRMNFSNATPEQIRVGIDRLAAVFAEALNPVATD
ncbi:MAG: PLP-dependent aminotransferase family protein [Chloroflexi bacterium]|nr:PLP-dependent aminotransferase family protein [Chloroflexota bacterium]